LVVYLRNLEHSGCHMMPFLVRTTCRMSGTTICQLYNVISLFIRSGGLIRMIYRVAIALLNKF
jgi:hypothetical protein